MLFFLMMLMSNNLQVPLDGSEMDLLMDDDVIGNPFQKKDEDFLSTLLQVDFILFTSVNNVNNVNMRKRQLVIFSAVVQNL